MQQVVMAALILVVANFVVFLGINFNFRNLQRDFYSKELKHSAKHALSSWQKIKLYLFVYFGLLLSFLAILWLVMTATV
jgi:ABC-type Fe3+ transport system permease subunit